MRGSSFGRPASPAVQLVCCLDEREESFRRHFEELAPSIETFGVAGFYGVAMYYRGAADAHFVPLCPVVIRPQHWVTEAVGAELGKSHRRRALTRRALGTASHQFHLGSRSFALGAILSGAVGVLATFPLVARILFPGLPRSFATSSGGSSGLRRSPRLQLERSDEVAGSENGHVGYTLEEMTNVGERQLQDIGLTTGFARLVILLGHGSESLNNPHNSAYNCGACGGAAGGPNARSPRADLERSSGSRSNGTTRLDGSRRNNLRGGYHNTCNESVDSTIWTVCLLRIRRSSRRCAAGGRRVRPQCS